MKSSIDDGSKEPRARSSFANRSTTRWPVTKAKLTRIEVLRGTFSAYITQSYRITLISTYTGSRKDLNVYHKKTSMYVTYVLHKTFWNFVGFVMTCDFHEHISLWNRFKDLYSKCVFNKKLKNETYNDNFTGNI